MLSRWILPVLLVLLGLSMALNGFELARQGHAATYSCQLVQGLAHIESEFLRTDATDRAGALTATEKQQEIAAFRKIIAAHLLAELVRKQNALDNATIGYWRTVLVPEAKALVRAAHCG